VSLPMPWSLFSSRLCAALVIFHVSLFAQWIEPSGADPVTVACPKAPTGAGINAFNAWRKARETNNVEGDGVLGIGNWGHTKEALEGYCQASAAGSPVAPYDIAEILRNGYAINSTEPNGRIITKHYLADLPSAFYWYQLSANRKFTKGMLAIAQYYSLGEQSLRGSHVPRDLEKALHWINAAAEMGDTTALTMLSMRYAGLKTAPWVMALPILPDRSKALTSFTSAIAILTHFDRHCTAADAIKRMVDQLPDAAEGRQVGGASIIEVHGSKDDGPTEVACVLSLTAPPSSQQNEPVIDQFYRLIHGGAVGSWAYTVIWPDANEDGILFRETATQAMTEGIEEMQLLVQTLHPLDDTHKKQ
jgi:TPR repeat protein